VFKRFETKSVGVAHEKNNVLQISCPAIYQTGSQALYLPRMSEMSTYIIYYISYAP